MGILCGKNENLLKSILHLSLTSLEFSMLKQNVNILHNSIFKFIFKLNFKFILNFDFIALIILNI